MSVVGAARRKRPGQNATGPELDEGLHALGDKRVETLAPADGAAQLGGQQLRPLVGVAVRAGVDVGNDDRVERMKGRRRERLAEPVPGAGHERGVEGAPDGHREHTFGAELLGDGAELGERLGGAGDDDLARSIEIRDPRLAVDAPAGRLDTLVVEAEHRDHCPGRELGGLAHRRAPFGDEAEPVLEVERACRDESRVLAQAVAGGGRGLDAEALGGVEDDEALDERGDLGVVGLGQSFLVGFEEEMGEIASR